MARVDPLVYESAAPERRELFDEGVRRYGRMTNMKATLAHWPAAYDALMTWYPLRDSLLPFLGERLANLYAHAISTRTDCLICSTYFRRVIVDAGENPDDLQLDDRARALVEFGAAIGRDPKDVPDHVYGPLKAHFDEPQIVALVAFAGMMVATNIVNNALRVDLDEYLVPYQGVK